MTLKVPVIRTVEIDTKFHWTFFLTSRCLFSDRTSCISLASFFRTMFSWIFFFFTISLFFYFEAMASVPICEQRIFIRENDNM